MADDEEHREQGLGEIMRAEYDRQKRAHERAEMVRQAIDRWNLLQAADAQAAQWAEQHSAEVEQAAAELDEAFVNAAISWLAERWGPTRSCPYCENTEWSVGTPFEVSLEDGSSLSPHFPVMCTNCGNTVFINAILAGLLGEPDE